MINNRTLEKSLIYLEMMLLKQPAFLMGVGVGVDDPKYQDNIDKLANIRKELFLVYREIRTKRKSNPQSDELYELSRLASRVQSMLNKITARNAQVGSAELVTKAIDLLQESSHNAAELVEYIENPNHQSFLMRTDKSVNVTDTLCSVMALLGIFLCVLEKHRRKNG